LATNFAGVDLLPPDARSNYVPADAEQMGHFSYVERWDWSVVWRID
jgi:hypothetical protein